VDDDVMVKPAEGDQVLGVGGATVGPVDNVVDLEAVSGIAPVD
jgi:hypothetical protein